MNPCIWGEEQCGTNALCRVVIHRAQCYCPPGMQGNPTIGCVPVGCQSHDDCSTDEVCDRLNRVCIKVCQTVTCGPRAICTGVDHQAECKCPPGMRGNPNIRCAPGKTLYYIKRIKKCVLLTYPTLQKISSVFSFFANEQTQ